MHITPPADDYGLQKLKQSDSKREVKETGKLEPYPRVESTEERHEPKEPVVAERREQQRRQRDRRRLSTKTILDTRENHERRNEQRRDREAKEDISGEGLSPRGVDDFA